MSGGYFGNQQYRIEDTAFEIDELIALNDSETLDRFGEKIGNGYPPEIIEKFEETITALRNVAEMVKRIDYLVSGDDGPETFLRLWQMEVRKSLDAPFLDYNAGLDTAYRLAQEVVGSTMEGETLLCGIESSKKRLKANTQTYES